MPPHCCLKTTRCPALNSESAVLALSDVMGIKTPAKCVLQQHFGQLHFISHLLAFGGLLLH